MDVDKIMQGLMKHHRMQSPWQRQDYFLHDEIFTTVLYGAPKR